MLREHSKPNHKTMILAKAERKTRITTSQSITKRIRKEPIYFALIVEKQIILHKSAGGGQMSRATIMVN